MVSALGLPFLEPFPFQFGDFFEEALQLPVVADGVAHPVLPSLRDANLAQLAVVTLQQIDGRMRFAVGAVAVGFAALAGAIRQRSAKQPLAPESQGQNAGRIYGELLARQELSGRRETRLDLRFEVFNAFNRSRFSTGATNIESPTFGQVNATVNQPRRMQLGLKLYW